MRKQGSFPERKEKMRSILLVLTLITLVGCSGPGVNIDEDADVMVDGGVDVDSMVLPDGSMPDSMTPDVTVVDLCGNDLVNIGETCDDGNQVSNDGCSNECLIEIGWDCNSSVPSVCTPVCGDTLVRGTETCDDGNEVTETTCNTYNGTCDICNNVCQTVTVVGPFCGDAVTNGTEECDDGNMNGGDICKNSCERPYPADATYICVFDNYYTSALNVAPALPPTCEANGYEPFEGYLPHVGLVDGDGGSQLANVLNGSTLTNGLHMKQTTTGLGTFTEYVRVCYTNAATMPTNNHFSTNPCQLITN
jgi:cysteine-rich repeat protein